MEKRMGRECTHITTEIFTWEITKTGSRMEKQRNISTKEKSFKVTLLMVTKMEREQNSLKMEMFFEVNTRTDSGMGTA